MFTLPIARREMLVLSRSPAVFRGRVAGSILLLVLGTAFGLVHHYAGLRATRPLVQIISFFLFLFCLFSGAHLTADALAREKREGTLGLLFLTNLNAFEITVGKLIAHGLMGFYGLLLVFPFLVLFLLAGGVSLGELAFIGLVASNTLFVSCAAGLLASSSQTERRKAVSEAIWIVSALWWGLPILGGILAQYPEYRWLADFLRLFALGGPAVPLQSTWPNLACTHLLGWAFIGMAIYELPRRWREGGARPRFSAREWWRELSHGKGAARERLRRKLMDRNPFLWLAARDRLRAFGAWIFTLIIFGFVGFLLVKDAFFTGLLVGLSLALCISHKGLVCGAASVQILAEQEQGTIEMILSTPLSVGEIVRGQLLALLRLFRGPLLLGILLNLLAIALLLKESGAGQKNLLPAIGMTAFLVVHLLDLYAACWLGMWAAVTVKEPKHVPGAAIARLILIPVFMAAFVVALFGGLNLLWGIQSPFQSAEMNLLASFFLVTANDLFWIARVRKLLPERLRTFAMRRYSGEERRGILAELGRRAARLWGREASSPPLLGATQ